MQTQRFNDRFAPLFADKGLVNIKFFVHDPDNCSLPAFMKEASDIQDTIAAGDTQLVGNVDEGCRKRRFDEPF